MKKLIFFVLSLLYAILPVDLLPDVLPGLGWIDDLVILGFVLYYISTGKVPPFLNRSFFRSRQNSTDRQTGGQKQDSKTSDNTYAEQTPHEILGVSTSASKEEIRAAYRKLANQYHPDKVAHLGEEFQQLAEMKFKAIQAAYQKLVKNKK